MDDYPCVKYFCTTGSGLESFLAQEVKCKLSANNVNVIPGRVFFDTSAPLEQILQLKSAERLFLLLHRPPPFQVPNNNAKAASLVQQSIVGDVKVWEAALCTWSRLKRRLEKEKTTRKRRREEEGDSKAELKSLSVQSPRDGIGELKMDAEMQLPTFRVSCRCRGVVAHHFTPQDLNRLIGSAVSQQLHLQADLREPDLEVSVYLSDDHCVVGILLSSHPLARRDYMKHTGLRSTVAWAVASVSNMMEGAIIVDPMCGVGAILLEAAKECPSVWCYGIDCEGGQLEKASENIEFAQLHDRVQVLQASAMGLPLPSDSVDVVLCDVPFGRKFSCGSSMADALPVIVKEMERVLRVGGSLVLLVSLQLSSQLKKMINRQIPLHPTIDPNTCERTSHGEDTGTPQCLTPLSFCTLCLSSSHKVSLGNTDGLIHSYIKTHSHR